MIRVKLRESMDLYRIKTGNRLSYLRLSKMSGVAEGTLNSIASRIDYNPNLSTIDKLCRALDVPIHKMLEIIDDSPEIKAKRKSKKKTKGTPKSPRKKPKKRN